MNQYEYLKVMYFTTRLDHARYNVARVLVRLASRLLQPLFKTDEDASETHVTWMSESVQFAEQPLECTRVVVY